MILLDATALLGALLEEPSGPEVEQILRGRDAAITAPNLAETIDILVRVMGHDLSDVESKLVPLIFTSLPVKSVGEREARQGALTRIVHYHRRTSPLSLADCLLLGAAAVWGARIATSDRHVAAAARSIQIPLLPLCNSAGTRP